MTGRAAGIVGVPLPGAWLPAGALPGEWRYAPLLSCPVATQVWASVFPGDVRHPLRALAGATVVTAPHVKTIIEYLRAMPGVAAGGTVIICPGYETYWQAAQGRRITHVAHLHEAATAGGWRLHLHPHPTVQAECGDALRALDRALSPDQPGGRNETTAGEHERANSHRWGRPWPEARPT